MQYFIGNPDLTSYCAEGVEIDGGIDVKIDY
jgi:hypothetical protein